MNNLFKFFKTSFHIFFFISSIYIYTVYIGYLSLTCCLPHYKPKASIWFVIMIKKSEGKAHGQWHTSIPGAGGSQYVLLKDTSAAAADADAG